MPFKDPEAHREYQRRWIAERRAAYLADKSCVGCGGRDELQIDHKDSGAKVTHRVWSWSEERRAVELVKCQVLCRECHDEKSEGALEAGYERPPEDVAKILEMRAAGVSTRQIAAAMGAARSYVWRVVTGKMRVRAAAASVAITS